jgi:hypothetical protein
MFLSFHLQIRQSRLICFMLQDGRVAFVSCGPPESRMPLFRRFAPRLMLAAPVQLDASPACYLYCGEKQACAAADLEAHACALAIDMH